MLKPTLQLRVPEVLRDPKFSSLTSGERAKLETKAGDKAGSLLFTVWGYPKSNVQNTPQRVRNSTREVLNRGFKKKKNANPNKNENDSKSKWQLEI